jgi:hypothetical protein
MYDIAVGDVLPATPGNEILGVDSTGSVYLVRRLAPNIWQGEVIWQDMAGPLHAVIAGDFLPDRPGVEILVAGQSGTATLLMLSPPVLRVALTTTNTLLIAWPAAATGYALQQNPDLATTNWTSVTNTPDLVGDEYQVILPPASGQGFYRLRH